jgi:hypothetical protein
MIMKVPRCFAALFAAGMIWANPVISIAEDDSDNRNHPSVNVYGDPAPDEMRQHRNEWNSEQSLAQLPNEEAERFGTTYCFTEAIIDESTGEVVAARQICEQPMLDLG